MFRVHRIPLECVSVVDGYAKAHFPEPVPATFKPGMLVYGGDPEPSRWHWVKRLFLGR